MKPHDAKSIDAAAADYCRIAYASMNNLAAVRIEWQNAMFVAIKIVWISQARMFGDDWLLR